MVLKKFIKQIQEIFVLSILQEKRRKQIQEKFVIICISGKNSNESKIYKATFS